MIREHLFHRRAPADPDFRWRGGDISRIEGLSDAAFALTLTLMVASAQPPRTFPDLWNDFRAMPAFALAFTMIGYCWYLHHRYFRRYGLEDTTTIALNLCLLFFIVFYAYPLRFLASFLTGGADEIRQAGMGGVDVWPFRSGGEAMMILYATGFALVFALFAILHRRAYALRDVLELDELERHITREALRCDLIMVATGLLSAAVMLTTRSESLAGLCFCLLGPVQGVHGAWSGRRTRALREALEREQVPQQEPLQGGPEQS